MILAIMQPYFFPYLGYFQLMSAVDHFVIYDDAQYMKGGWVNRNRLLSAGLPRWWTRPIERDNFRLPIMQRRFNTNASTADLMGQVDAYYGSAPFYASTRALLDELLSLNDPNVARFNEACLAKIAAHVGINCTFSRSSDLAFAETTGQEKVIRICNAVGARRYINMAGGRELYQADAFAAEGVELTFLEPSLPPYKQFGDPFVAGLSIVDVLMFNSPERITQFCRQHTLTGGEA